MERRQTANISDIIPGLLPNAFAAHNGISIVKSSQDEVEAALTIGETSLNPYGSLHGGAYYTLADAAGSSLSRMDGRRYVTLRGELDFISSVSSGKVIAKAKLCHRSSVLCHIAIDIVSEEQKLLATGIFTFYCIEKVRELKNSPTNCKVEWNNT